MKLNNWYIAGSDGKLSGEVEGDPARPNGQEITVGFIVEFNTATEEFTTRSGRVYKLGNPKPDYEEQFPNSRNRLIATIVATLEELE